MSHRTLFFLASCLAMLGLQGIVAPAALSFLLPVQSGMVEIDGAVNRSLLMSAVLQLVLGCPFLWWLSNALRKPWLIIQAGRASAPQFNVLAIRTIMRNYLSVTTFTLLLATYVTSTIAGSATTIEIRQTSSNITDGGGCNFWRAKSENPKLVKNYFDVAVMLILCTSTNLAGRFCLKDKTRATKTIKESLHSTLMGKNYCLKWQRLNQSNAWMKHTIRRFLVSRENMPIKPYALM